MTQTLTPPIDRTKLETAAPGIYPWEITEGRYAGRMAVHVPPTYMTRLQQIPGALYSKADSVWTLPRAWPTVLALKAMADEMGIRILPHPELQAWVTEQAGHWKRLRELAEHLDPGAVKTGTFYPHQEADGDWLSYGDGVQPTRARLLLSETGIGKTAGAINGLRKLNLPDVNRPVLVVAPKKTLKTAWADDLAEYLPHAEVVVADGTATQRRKAIEKIGSGDTPQVLVIGWESMKTHTRFAPFPGQSLKKCTACGGPQQSEEETVTEAKCQAHPKELNGIPWAVVIADELHRAMNNTSAVTQALWGVVKAAPGALRWGMTGTLVSKQVEQVWSSLHTVDPEAWPVKGSWVDYYAETGYNMAGFHETYGLKPTREAEFQQVFRAVSRRRLKAEVLDLPPLIMGGGMIREVGMGTEQRKAYEMMRDEMVLAVKEGTLIASDPMQAAGRLSALASATGYPDPKWEAEAAAAEAAGKPLPSKRMLLRLPSGKVDAVLEDLKAEEFPGQIAMSMTSRRLLRLLEQSMVDTGIDPDEIACIAGDMAQADADQAIYDFQNGKKRFVLYTYAAGGTGITLTAAGTLLRVERSWSPILWKQGLDRVHRIGSERHGTVNVFDYVTAGTIEEKQIDRHGQDAALLEGLMNDQGKLDALADLLA